MLAGLSLVIIGVAWPPHGCIAGAALLAWGSTHVVLRSRPQLAAINLLVYAMPLLLLIGAAADLLQRNNPSIDHTIWLGELVITVWLIVPLTHRVIRTLA
jgi:hypothetical protein